MPPPCCCHYFADVTRLRQRHIFRHDATLICRCFDVVDFLMIIVTDAMPFN